MISCIPKIRAEEQFQSPFSFDGIHLPYPHPHKVQNY